MQNARPTPVMIPTHKLSSWSNRSQISAISRLVALSMQFSLSGRLMVTCTMCSSGKETWKCRNCRGWLRNDMADRLNRGLDEERQVSGNAADSNSLSPHVPPFIIYRPVQGSNSLPGPMGSSSDGSSKPVPARTPMHAISGQWY